MEGPGVPGIHKQPLTLITFFPRVFRERTPLADGRGSRERRGEGGVCRRAEIDTTRVRAPRGGTGAARRPVHLTMHLSFLVAGCESSLTRDTWRVQPIFIPETCRPLLVGARAP